ncbi:hypothetical protein B0H13DRAFT_1497679, partial [Mycena leptocephala]
LYRCFAFWSDSSPWVVALPALLFLASTALGIAMTIQSGLPGGSFFHGITINLTPSWLSLTIAFNIITTSMIAFRLLAVSRNILNVLDRERVDVYSGIIAILVESAAPFTLLGIGYLITYVRGDPESLFCVNLWGIFVAL